MTTNASETKNTTQTSNVAPSSATTTTMLAAALQGLKVGLEIHQQVGTTNSKKLFCNCQAEIIERPGDVVVTRQLRASAGETGSIDSAAKAEQTKGKTYVYHAFQSGTCLVELDEEPPHPVNQEVITTAVMIAKACQSAIMPHVQFMRKTIVDGSATSGFQRTGLVALGGVIPECSPPVRIQTICVEEDAAKIITRTNTEDTYNLSRLGIPLIEIATEPDITTPKQAQEVAAQLGMILRSTKRVKRGLGTIRQDINVSIPNGTRVEIKGAQDLRMITTLIEYEALRQKNLLGIMERYNFSFTQFSFTDVTAIFSKSTTPFIKNGLTRGDKAIALLLPKLKGVLGTELCPNYRVGSELADLARYAGFGGLIHADEDLKKYGIADHVDELKNTLHATAEDSFVILIGNEMLLRDVFNTIIIPRIKQFGIGIPKEVRKANPDGTTSFLRPMPGAARMYPETDIPVVVVHSKSITAPKLFTEQVKELTKKYSINEEQAKEIVRQGVPFEEYMDKYTNIDAIFLATALLTYGKEIASRYKKEIDHIPIIEHLLPQVMQNTIPKYAVFEILVAIAQGTTTLATIDLANYTPIKEEELIRIVRQTISENPGAKPNMLMGKVMQLAKGKADGKKVMELLEQEQKNLL